MKYRLVWLNLVLLALVIAAGAALRDRWSEARRKEEKMRNAQAPAAPALAIAPVKPVQPAKPEQYIEVAEKMLFTRDRNPAVILDPPPPPPPPKPMPALPVAYGVMDLGLGPLVIMAPRPGAPHKSYKVGETIGQFKLIAADTRALVLEWEGKQIRKTLEELKDKTPVAQEQASNTPAPLPSQAPAAAPAKPGPGADTGAGFRACNAGDPSPAGAVVDGMKKVVIESPFGKSCRWEPVK